MVEAPHTGDVIKTTSINLNRVSAVRRVINGATGTAINGNLLRRGGHRSVTTMAGNLSGLLQGMVGNTFSGGSLSLNDLVGYDPKQAMSGGVSSGGGGLGQGADLPSPHTSAMAQSYLSLNNKTGMLESSNNTSGNIFNYGGITVEVKVPHGAQITPKELSKAIKAELKSLPISVKVAST
jgi:hypothetical protein